MIAIESTAYLNLNRPDLYSDVFCVHRRSLSTKTLLTFDSPAQPLTAALAERCASLGITPVVVDWRATRTVKARFCTRWPIMEGWRNIANTDTASIYSYWLRLFKRFGVKVYVSWHRYDTRHAAIHAAIKAVGGTSVIYQRSLNPAAEDQYPMTAGIACVAGPSTVETEIKIGSKVSTYKITGYLGDFRAKLLAERARFIRKSLTDWTGATYVIAYFDQNSAPDRPPGHEMQRSHYTFMLHRLLGSRHLAIIFKPKAPHTLRERLGPEVWRLMEEARATSRAMILGSENTIMSDTPPALAAMAADIAIHGHARAGTAGVEARLAGTPTVFLNEEKQPCGVIADTGAEFFSWKDLWPQVELHVIGQNPTLGQWKSSTLDYIDPFRDGRARERMADVLEGLL